MFLWLDHSNKITEIVLLNGWDMSLKEHQVEPILTIVKKPSYTFVTDICDEFAMCRLTREIFDIKTSYSIKEINL